MVQNPNQKPFVEIRALREIRGSPLKPLDNAPGNRGQRLGKAPRPARINSDPPNAETTRLMRTLLATLLLVLTALLAIRAGEDLKPGLIGEYYEFADGLGDFPKVPPEKKPSIRRVDKQINVDNCDSNFGNTNLSENFYVKWTGAVQADKAGKYKFAVESDDGSRLFVDGKPVVQNGGSHPMSKAGGEIELQPGPHQIVVEYFQGNGQMGCKFYWTPPGKNEEIVPEGALSHKSDAE